MNKLILILISSLLMIITSYLLSGEDIRANAEEIVKIEIKCLKKDNKVCYFYKEEDVLLFKIGEAIKVVVEDPDDDTHL